MNKRMYELGLVHNALNNMRQIPDCSSVVSAAIGTRKNSGGNKSNLMTIDDLVFCIPRGLGRNRLLLTSIPEFILMQIEEYREQKIKEIIYELIHGAQITRYHAIRKPDPKDIPKWKSPVNNQEFKHYDYLEGRTNHHLPYSYESFSPGINPPLLSYKKFNNSIPPVLGKIRINDKQEK